VSPLFVVIAEREARWPHHSGTSKWRHVGCHGTERGREKNTIENKVSRRKLRLDLNQMIMFIHDIRGQAITNNELEKEITAYSGVI
jgi:hypothetical protein